MANYFQLFQRGFKNRYLRKIYIPENKLDCIINHPGGCGGVTLSKHINQFQYNNYHIEKEYGYQKAIAHLIKPPSVFYKKKIKVIILKIQVEIIKPRPLIYLYLKGFNVNFRGLGLMITGSMNMINIKNMQ